MSGAEDAQDAESIGGVAASLIGDLAAEGTQVDEGGFTLDPAKALEKLRAFQLAVREAWVLFLVEAASLVRDRRPRIAFWSGEDLVVDFDGPALGASQLESLLLAPFEKVPRDDDEARAIALVRRCLAMALNASLAVERHGLELLAVDAEGQGQRLRLDPAGAIQVEACADAKPGVISVRRFGQGMDGQLLSARELDIVRARCCYASFPVTCDGARISGGVEAILEGKRHCEITDAEGRRLGLATRVEGATQGRAMFVVRGVVVETLTPKSGGHDEFLAVVDVDLPTDLGSSQVLRGPAFDRVVEAISAAHEVLGMQSAEWGSDAVVEPTYLLCVAGTDEQVCVLTGAQLDELHELLVREHAGDRDYYIDDAAVEWLALHDADPEIVAALRDYVAQSGPRELTWVEQRVDEPRAG